MQFHGQMQTSKMAACWGQTFGDRCPQSPTWAPRRPHVALAVEPPVVPGHRNTLKRGGQKGTWATTPFRRDLGVWIEVGIQRWLTA